jgi:hypothetical protein
LSSFAISHFHRQSEILRFAQDDRLADSFTASFAMGHILPPLRGSDGRGDLRLTPMGRCPRLLMFSSYGAARWIGGHISWAAFCAVADAGDFENASCGARFLNPIP